MTTRVYRFGKSILDGILTRRYTDGSGIQVDFVHQPQISIPDWDKIAPLDQDIIKSLLTTVGWDFVEDLA